MFVFDANLLCLDLVNTRQRRDGEPVDLLDAPGGVAAWLEAAGRAWGYGSAGAPRDGRALDAAARRLRDAVQAVADDHRAGRPARRSAVAAVNELLVQVPRVVVVDLAGAGPRRTLVPTHPGPLAPLAPVLDSAVELLTGADPARVGRCAGPDCILYFYDTTKNRSRRWCSMDRCGNRAKVAAHYERHHGTGD